MAKSRAQRKAEQRARQAAGQQERQEESRAQHATQVPESAEVVEAKIVEQTGVSLEELQEPGELQAPAPSRADAPPPAAPPKPSRRERAEEKRRQQAVAQQATRQKERKPAAPAPTKERRRGAVLAFFASSWAELKRVQWPDRETLVQASAVTVVFVAVAAAYLGALDALFSFVVKRVL